MAEDFGSLFYQHFYIRQLHWLEDHDQYQVAFKRLLRDLKQADE